MTSKRNIQCRLTMINLSQETYETYKVGYSLSSVSFLYTWVTNQNYDHMIKRLKFFTIEPIHCWYQKYYLSEI